MAKESGVPNDERQGGGDLPSGDRKNHDYLLPAKSLFSTVSEILKNHPVFMGFVIVAIFAVAIFASCPAS